MKKLLVGVVVFLVGACGQSPKLFFLNRMVTMDKTFSRIKEKELIPIAVLRYRWLSSSQALVYGMDEAQDRGWWLWDEEEKKFFPLEGEVQGFDLSGKTVMAFGKVWEDGYPLWLGKVKERRFVREKELRFSLTPENSASLSGGFYLAGKDAKDVHRIFFLSTNAELKELLVLTNKEATIRFVRLGKRWVVYTSYDREQETPSLFAFLDENFSWQKLVERGTVVQKAVSLENVIAFPVSYRGKIQWVVFDETMQQVGEGPLWEALVFEELLDNFGFGRGVFLCFLPTEKRSVLMVFRWDSMNWQWKTFLP